MMSQKQLCHYHDNQNVPDEESRSSWRLACGRERWMTFAARPNWFLSHQTPGVDILVQIPFLFVDEWLYVNGRRFILIFNELNLVVVSFRCQGNREILNTFEFDTPIYKMITILYLYNEQVVETVAWRHWAHLSLLVRVRVGRAWILTASAVSSAVDRPPSPKLRPHDLYVNVVTCQSEYITNFDHDDIWRTDPSLRYHQPM